MFLKLLGRSFSRRKGKIAMAIVAVVMGAAIVSALFTVSLDVSEKVNLEFRKFGANLLVVPESETIEVGIGDVGFGSVTDQNYINQSDVQKVKEIVYKDNVLGYAPFLYQVVDISNGQQEQAVILAGTWFDKETIMDDGALFDTGVKHINIWWNVEGMWIDDANDSSSVMLGSIVAEKMALSIGDTATITYGEDHDPTNQTIVDLTVIGIIDSGSAEDNQIFVTLDTAQDLTGRHNEVHTIQVSALCTGCPVDEFARVIEEDIPYVEARTVQQLASAEMNILEKIEDMMAMVTIVALLASAMGVLTTMTASVVERRREIGLMKSLGAENKRIAAFFLSEATIIGVIGGLAGFLIGIILAHYIGLSVFGSSVSPRLIVLPIVMGVSISVAIIASLIPVRRATNIEPVVVLRGD